MSAGVSSVRPTPDGRRCLHLWLVGGTLEGALKLEQAACIWGREQGCVVAAVEGREGWKRAFPGYRVDSVRLVKEL